MLKVAALLLILSGCSGLGWYAAGRYALRIRILEELEQALQFLYGEIEYAGSDMVELLSRLALRSNRCRGLWEGMEKGLSMADGQPFLTHWQSNLRRIAGYGSLEGEELELLGDIGANLGNLDRQTQLHTLAIFQDRLRGITKQARKEYRGRAKISGVVGVTAGFFLAILLL